MQDKTKLLLSVKEVAEAMGISQRTVWTLAKTGELPVCKIGTRRLFSLSEIQRFIEAHSAVESQPQNV